MQTSISILEFLPENCVVHLKLNLLRSRMYARDFFAEVSANGLMRHKCFLWKIASYTVLQSLQLCVPQQLFKRAL